MSADLRRYLSVHGASGASLGAPDELAVLYDATGEAQVWTVDAPGTWPEQRTVGADPVSFVDASPTNDEWVFGRDAGGNERMQFFRLDTDGNILPLTDLPDAKHRWGGWSPNGERFSFASNRRDRSVFDIYVQGRDEQGAAARLVRKSDGWFTVAGWSPTGDRLAVVEAHGSYDQDVYTLALDGSMTHLTPDTEGVRFLSVEWGPEGEALYCVTDQNRDTLELARITISTGELSIVEHGGDYDIDGIAVHRTSGAVVFSRNVEGFTELTAGRLVDGRLERRTMPVLPGGVAGGVSFAPDGDRFALTVAGRTVNPNVYVVELADNEGSATVGGPAVAAGIVDGGTDDAGATQWTRAAKAGLSSDGFVSPELVRFDSFDGLEVPALFSSPTEVPGGGAPVIVDIHGGPESQRRPGFSGLTQYFLSRGYAVLEPNVRGSSGYGREYAALDDIENRLDAVADLAAAHDWLRDHNGVDADRVALKGASYGGFMVLAAMTEYPDRWAAGIDIVGIANFVTFLENTGDWRRQLREAEYGSLTNDRDLLEAISPINRVDAIDAPLFVIHGENDPRVPVGEARQIADAAREQGVPVELRIFGDEGHGLAKLDNRIEAYTDVITFLDEHL
ncbi:MAG: alpha/beta fold hydrolase [Salinirussus sp.]